MLSILIICYLRPGDLSMMLKKLAKSSRKIYIFIDFADGENSEINKRVIEVAESFQTQLDISILHSQRNLGVGKAVPYAIDWIASHEEEFIVLEDDCHISDNGIEFLEKNKTLLRNTVSLICATSPWDLPWKTVKWNSITTSSYPLISGWATSAKNWHEISFLVGAKPPYWNSLMFSLKHPRQIRAICYFLAAQIRIAQGKLNAWDCSVALGMLLTHKISLIPNVTTVTNTGRDEAASHTKPNPGEDRIFRRGSIESPSSIVSLRPEDFCATNNQIEKYVYGIRTRHLLSPAKSILSRYKKLLIK